MARYTSDDCWCFREGQLIFIINMQSNNQCDLQATLLQTNPAV